MLLHGKGQKIGAELASFDGRQGFGKEKPNVGTIAGARAFECAGNFGLFAGDDKSESVVLPAVSIKIDGKKIAGVIEQHRVKSDDKIIAAWIMAGQM